MTWKAFEELIALIQRQTAPTATVRHNQKIRGRTGRLRQLDVTLSARVGLHEVLIVIECKRYKRRVGIEKVEAFASKLRDVNASQGVMISPKGFDAGALAAAKELNIGLWSYREAIEADWRALVGPTAWITFTISTLEDLSGTVRMKEAGLDLDDRPVILNAQGQKLHTIDEILQSAGDKLLLLPPGNHTIAIESSVPEFVRVGSDLHAVESVLIQVRNRARQYVYNLQLGGGHVLERTVPATGAFQQLHSQPWRADEIIRTQEGRELSVEEWKQTQGPPAAGERRVMNHIVRDLSMRFRIAATNDESAVKANDS